MLESKNTRFAIQEGRMETRRRKDEEEFLRRPDAAPIIMQNVLMR